MTMVRRKAAHARRGQAQRAQAQRGRADANPHDALVLLTADHNIIDKLVREFDRARKAGDPVEKGKTALRICHALEIYAVIKHEVLYPAADAVLEDDDKALLGKARVRHHGVHELIDKVESTPADDPTFDALVSVLGEEASRLMKQEEEELFPRLRHSQLDLVGTGERMAARKTELATAPIDRDTIHQARKVMAGRD
jgi:Hemerythrin HHE cation binding domain